MLEIVQWQKYNLQWKIVKQICWFCSHSSWKMNIKRNLKRGDESIRVWVLGALKCKTSWMTQISPSPCHSMCVHFVNTQIIEKHFCVDAAVWNIPCSVEIVKLHRKILIETANIYFNIDTCTMVHVECMLRQAGKLFSCSCTPSCNNLNKQTHKKLQQLIAIDYDSKSAYF